MLYNYVMELRVLCNKLQHSFYFDKKYFDMKTTWNEYMNDKQKKNKCMSLQGYPR